MLRAKESGSQTASADCGAHRGNVEKVFVHFTDMYSLVHSVKGNIKVKCTLVQALRLCTGRPAHRGVEV